MPVIFNKEQQERNQRAYLKAPSPKEIKDFMEELGIRYDQFEKFFGIPTGVIPLVLGGWRNLPVRFWHIIYEKIKPAYGVGHLYDHPSVINETKKEVVEKQELKELPKSKSENHLEDPKLLALTTSAIAPKQ